MDVGGDGGLEIGGRVLLRSGATGVLKYLGCIDAAPGHFAGVLLDDKWAFMGRNNGNGFFEVPGSMLSGLFVKAATVRPLVERKRGSVPRRGTPSSLEVNGGMPTSGAARGRGSTGKVSYASMAARPAAPRAVVRPPLGACGLRNLGNTCFVNSVLQNLLALKVAPWVAFFSDTGGESETDGSALLSTPDAIPDLPGPSKGVPAPVVSSALGRAPRRRRSAPRTTKVTGSKKAAGRRPSRTSARPSSSVVASGRQSARPLTKALQQLHAVAREARGELCDPSVLFNSLCRRVPRFGKRQQQDSVEAMRYIMDILIGENRNVASAAATLRSIEQTFLSMLSSTITCAFCGHQSVNIEESVALSLPLHPKILAKDKTLGKVKGMTKEGRRVSGQGKPGQSSAAAVPTWKCVCEQDNEASALMCSECSAPRPAEGTAPSQRRLTGLEGSLKWFSSHELVEDYRCGGCGEAGASSKQYLLYKLADVVVLHLKRFAFTTRGLQKVSRYVSYPRELDVEPYMNATDRERAPSSQSAIFELSGLVVHGGSMIGGHYVAYVKHQRGDGREEWWYHSDSRLRKATVQEVMKKQAYLLFYVRTKPPATAAPSWPDEPATLEVKAPAESKESHTSCLDEPVTSEAKPAISEHGEGKSSTAAASDLQDGKQAPETVEEKRSSPLDADETLPRSVGGMDDTMDDATGFSQGDDPPPVTGSGAAHEAWSPRLRDTLDRSVDDDRRYK